MTTTETMIDVADFPGPHGVPVLGNLFDLDLQNPIESLIKMAREYGPIFKLSTPNDTRIIVSGVELVNEVCDDARFDKYLAGGLVEMSKGVGGHGLFTSETSDPRWQRAHAILMAPFSMQAMEQYVPKMQDIADQLIGKWDRLNPGEFVDVPADMTNLTLDTIALCGFGYRFNSFYRETPHPLSQPWFVRCWSPRRGPVSCRSRLSCGFGRSGNSRRIRPTWRVSSTRSSPNASNKAMRQTTPTSWAGCWRAGIPAPVKGWMRRTSATSASPSLSRATRPPADCCPSRSTSC